MSRTPQCEGTAAVVFRRACPRAGRGAARRLRGGRGGECRAGPRRRRVWSFPASGIRAGGRSGPTCAHPADPFPHRATNRRSTIPVRTATRPASTSTRPRPCDELRSPARSRRALWRLLDALNDNRGDAAIASISLTAGARQRADFTDPYYRMVARFAARRTADQRRAAGTDGG